MLEKKVMLSDERSSIEVGFQRQSYKTCRDKTTMRILGFTFHHPWPDPLFV
jgi:hypothetical protein